MKLSEIKKLHLEGKQITFDIINHKNIPNAVLCDNSIVGMASITTINNFKIWIDGKNI